MAQTGLVIVSNFSKLSHILASAKSHVSKTLYISFAPTLRLPLLSYNEHLTGIYTQVSNPFNNNSSFYMFPSLILGEVIDLIDVF